VLRMATSGAADALGFAGRKGIVAPGADADLVAVAGDPVEQLETLLTPFAVLARGRFAVGPAGAAEATEGPLEGPGR
ncbi:MAG TPA: amidohydrolase family protein, partial [Egibacteraceae bacterium]|nr:amidohydrolase family protein [Egibacteraceae bacterium]